jgi:hypothetical protein
MEQREIFFGKRERVAIVCTLGVRFEGRVEASERRDWRRNCCCQAKQRGLDLG